MKVLLPMAFLWAVYIATNVAVDTCINTDNGATDTYGDGCDEYREDWCGEYDDEEFDSGEMCCICGGGQKGGDTPTNSPSDTTPSSQCKNNEWRCDNGECIPQSYLCDDEPDCEDGSDETTNNCPTETTPTNSPPDPTPSSQCNNNEWRCDNGQCIPQSYLCDNEADCEDGSDESTNNCPTETTPTNSPPDPTPSSQCRSDQWLCDNRIQCIPNSYLCDNYEGGPDCRDGSDESDKHCSKGVRSEIDNLLKEKKVLLISLSYCVPCKRVKKVLAEYNIPKEYIEILDIDKRLNDEDRNELVEYMMELTGARTFPRVFIGGKFIGGSSDTLKLDNNGQLEPLLKSVGALP